MANLFKAQFLKSEDWLAVFLGLLIIFFVLIGIRPQLPVFKWATKNEFLSIIESSKSQIESFIKDVKAQDNGVLLSTLELKSAIFLGDRMTIEKALKKFGEDVKKIKDPFLRKRGLDIHKRLDEGIKAHISRIFSRDNILKSVYIGIAFLILTGIGIALMGGRVSRYVVGFPIIYVIAWFSQFIAGNTTVNYWGLEYVIFALIIGLFISNVFGVPDWLREAVRTEYYIKTGIVILGAGILFFEILQAGAIGIVQAILVVFIVWYACFWLARKLKVDEELAVMLATGVSICGVSAAIAACGAIKGDKKKLSYTISLILIIAVPMMILEPWVAKSFGIPEIVAGAWFGGTLDTTGSVVAAGALISETAMKVGTIVKFSQNVLIGVAAFILSIWWTLKKDNSPEKKPSLKVIWERFPKFVLGFLFASFLFSFFLDPTILKETTGILGGLRTIWFALAFSSIGLETRFIELFKLGEGRPALAFIGAQIFNVLWTLLLAYILFGGFIVPTSFINPIR